MSTLKVDAIRHNSATSDALTTHSDGTASAKIIDVGGAQLSNRRINVNGAMTISQKGTSVSGNAYNGYPLVTDMVNYRRTGGWSGTTWTVSNIAQTPTTLSPFTNFTRWTQAGTVQNAPNDTSTKLQYGIEGQDMAHAMWGQSSAKPCTLSFYVRSSQTGTFCIWVANSNTNYNYIIEYTISAANTWQRVTHTIPGPTSGTFNINNTAAIKFYFIIAGHAASSTYGGGTKNVWNTSGRWTSNQSTAVSANAGATWDITGIQFEVGDTATSFEYRSFGDELRRCQRYYYQVGGQRNDGGPDEPYGVILPHAMNASSIRVKGVLEHPVHMRDAPSIVGGGSGTAKMQSGDNTSSSVLVYQSTWANSNSTKYTWVDFSPNSGTISQVGYSGVLYANNDTYHLKVSAEL